jgi:anionic cell wall polymer biosynthesis LytR-Cps2A-Psr (LCP) family protein
MVYVPEDIDDPRFPNPKGGYEHFTLERGWRYLDPGDALRFVRTRHSARGDFDRMLRQQELLRAMKGKLSSLNPLWDFSSVFSLYSLARNEVATDLDENALYEFWTALSGISLSDVHTLPLDGGSGLLTSKTVHMSGVPVSALVSARDDAFNYEAVREKVKETLER